MSSLSNNYEQVNFRNEENMSKRLSTVEPQCMKDLPKEEPSRQSLTEEQTKVAKEALVSKEYISLSFPKTMRLHSDPVLNGQTYCLVSFIPSTGSSPDKD